AHTTSTSTTTSAIRIRLIWPRKIVRHTGSSAKNSTADSTVTRAGETHWGSSPFGRGSAPMATRITSAIATSDTADSTPHATCNGSTANGTNSSAAVGG